MQQLNSLWPVYTNVNNQIWHLQEVKHRLYLGKMVISVVLFCYVVQSKQEDLIISLLLIAPPFICLLFDLHIRATTKKLRAQHDYLREHVEPLFHKGMLTTLNPENRELYLFLQQRFKMPENYQHIKQGETESVSEKYLQVIYTAFVSLSCLFLIYSHLAL